MNKIPRQPKIKKVSTDYPTLPLKYGVERQTNKFDQVPDELPRISLDMIESWTGKVRQGDQNGNASTGLVEFQSGDVLFSKLRPYLAKAFQAERRGAASPELLVLRPTEFTPRYLLYLLLSQGFIDRVDSSTYGAKMPRASWDFIGDIRVPKPPTETQKSISSFLDHHIKSIGEIIRKCELINNLLQERQNSFITSKVIEGLDQCVNKVESDITWFEQLPSHWDRIRVKYLLNNIEQGWSPQCNDKPSKPGEWGVLKAGCVNGMSFTPNENKQLPENLEPRPELSVKKGDVLMSRANTRDLVGSCAIVAEKPSKLMLCDKIYRFNLREDIVDPRYFVHAMNADTSREQIELDATGTSQSMVNISQEFVKNMWITLPPLDEQKEIAQRVANENNRMISIKNSMTRTIELLEERQKVLVTKAINGEFELKDWQQNNTGQVIS